MCARSLHVLALTVFGLLLPTRAAAQGDTCVLLPDPGTQAPATVREQAQSAIVEELRGRGHVVLPTRDAQLRMLGQPMRECAAIECAAEVNRFLGTGIAVLTELSWVSGRVTVVHVALVGLDDGESVGGQAEVSGGDVSGAARTAFRAAWDRWEASQQGYLVVTTVPPGAFIELDGTSLGRAPIRRLARAGVHTLRATLEGHGSVEREITIDRHEERTIELTLAAAGASAPETRAEIAPGPPTTREETHWASYVVGGALIAAGAGALVSPIWTIADQGQVVSTGSGPDEYVEVGPVSGVLLGLGAAALVGGVVFLVTQPIRATVTATPNSAGLALGGSF